MRNKKKIVSTVAGSPKKSSSFKKGKVTGLLLPPDDNVSDEGNILVPRKFDRRYAP